jgi:NAD(P)-dependent dehydrogenase (short-subunit alcohol dehydrogenase family)
MSRNGETSLFRLDGKVAAIVGAGSGIGAAVAAGAATHGATVCCLDIDESAAAAVASAIGAPASAAPLDIRDGRAVTDAFDRLISDLGHLDIVVCTPSINVRKPILQYTDDDFDRVVTLNLKGSFHVVQAAGRIMTRQGSGSIIVFSSIRAHVVEPGQSVYAATKAGIVQLVRAAATEFGPFGVRVNAIGPGIVDTALTSQIKDDPDWYRAYAEKSVLKRWAAAEEIVGPTLFLASDAASFVTGTILMADGGWTAADGRFTPPGM